jgi:hypothetical protein
MRLGLVVIRYSLRRIVVVSKNEKGQIGVAPDWPGKEAANMRPPPK